MAENGNGHNGHTPALAFKPSTGIPIIGQPFTIKGWFPTVLLICNCGKGEAVMVPKGGAAACPACSRVFTIQAVQGNVQFGIGIMVPDGAEDKGAIHG